MKLTKRTKQISDLALEWCILNLGNPLKTISPTLTLKEDKRITRTYGYYQDRNIVINLNPVENSSRLISTIIHEYCHYLQSPRISGFTKYWKLNDKFGYDNNPFEIEARQFESLYFNDCYTYIMKNL